jgi:hypothetical protein
MVRSYCDICELEIPERSLIGQFLGLWSTLGKEGMKVEKRELLLCETCKEKLDKFAVELKNKKKK